MQLNSQASFISNFRVKLFILLAITLAGNQLVKSQNFNYLTTTGNIGTTYSWIDCSGGSNITSGRASAAAINWPFNFRFYNSTYTSSNTLSVCTNGFIRLDGTASTTAATATAFTLGSASTELGQIVALGVYENKVGDGGGWVRSATTGAAPNRIFTIEYNNLEIDFNDGFYADLQVSFYETSNKIVLKFGSDNVTRTLADIGLHSGTSGYFNDWQDVDNGTNNRWIEYTLPPVEVNATGGTTLNNYNTIKEAFDAINAGTHTGTLTVKVNGSITETATAVLNASGSGSASYTSLNMYPTTASLSVSGSLATPLIQLNGADNVTIDGRVNQTGATSLAITNSSTASGARTIELINSAEANYIQYCTISGAGTSATQGVINISTSTSGNGNDGNYIQYNNLKGVSSSDRPTNIIYSAGASGYINNQNYIRNNNIYDFLRLGAASNGIMISSFSSGFSITDNSFYQTASFVPTASVDYDVIRIDNTSGNDFVITGNFIGGSAANASGTWTKTNAFNNGFEAIYMNVGTTNNSLQNNIIDGFSYANSGAANWIGINIAGGTVGVGTALANVIGETTGTGAITFTAGATGASFYGIYVASTSTMTVSNNIIGSITVATANGAHAANFYGIHKTAGAGSFTATYNAIGSAVTANSIQTSSAATGNSQILYGIYNLGTGAITISNNTVSNLTNSTTETTLSSRTRGIFTNDGANTVESNTVFKLNTTGLSSGANFPNAAIVGISVISNTLGNAQSINKNTIYNIETTATGKTEMYGIFYDGPDDIEAIISRNFVHTYVVPTDGSTGTYLHGISLFDGSYIASNNIVYLGSNITIGCSIWGIWTGTNDAGKIYHNTIYLTGTATSGTSNSYAFRSLNCPSSLDIRNNIWWDGRINSSGLISHFAIYLGCTTNVTLNYNDYQFAQQFGRVGGTTYDTFAAWKTGTSYDANSLNTDPQLVNLGGTQPVDYQTNVQLTGTTLAAIPTDFDNVNRVTPTMGAWEFFANPVEIWNGDTYRNAYPTLKGAFDVINAGTYTGDMIIKFRGNTTETASAVLNASGTGAASYSRILIYPARTGITITGDLATPMVELNGSDKVTFDGRVNGTDDAYAFTFINNSTSATAGTSTFRFSNTATSDTIRYCLVKGGATGTATGTIIIGSASSVSGNNNNVITNNKITSLSATNRPVNVVYSAGAIGFANTGTKIQSNEIFDFFRPASASFGVNIQAYSNATTISGNSFYETTSFAPSSTAAYRVINIDDTNSNTNVISSNFIGGNAASAAGTWTKTNANNNEFNAIYINAGTSTASTIDGNIIKNISYGNSANANWYGIHVAGGAVNVGKIAGNTLGATTGTGSLAITNATSATTSEGTVFGINIASTGTVQVENNNIGSITAANASTNATNFVGINKTATAGTTSILKNTIGSTATAKSVNASSGSTSNAQTVYAIKSDGTGAITINENTIANTTNSTTNTTIGTRGRINGILITDGTANTVNANTIRNLTIANANTANDLEVSAIGINLINTIANRTITNNVIYSLSNTYASYAGSVIGIYYRGATTGTNTVAQNFIHSLSATNAGSSLIGIFVSSGNTTYSNNIISLGNATNNLIYGIYDLNNTSQTCNAYYNTVYISGATSGAFFSYAMYSGLALGTRNYRNNIFTNTRTNSTPNVYNAGIGYATNSTAGLTTDYNNYYVNGTGTVVGLWNGATRTLATLRTSTLGDTNSNTTNPTFVNGGSTTATDYKVGVTLTAATGTGIASDYGAFSRPATAPTMGAWERNVNKWKGTNSTDWGTASNWTGNLVPDVDATIEFDPVPVRHCIMDINRSVTNIINAQGTYRVVTNGKVLTVKGELQFTNGAQIDASAASSKVIFAGASAQNIPSGSFYNNEVFNLEVNNANHVTLNGTVRLLNTISSTTGRFDAYLNSPNFIYGGTTAQTIENNVFLDNKAYNMTIDNTAGVNLNTDFTLNNNLTINTGKLFTINTTRTMTVSGTVTNSAGENGLVIKSSSTQANGSLIFYNSEVNAVPATVEMYSKATWNLSNATGSKYNWQYFGVPVRAINAYPTFNLIPSAESGIPWDVVNQGFIRRWNEPGDVYTYWQQLYNDNTNRGYNDSTLTPFYGYEICHSTSRTFAFKGELVNKNFNSNQLAKTTGAKYPGQHLLANPYTAAIDIRQIEFGSDMEATVYLYNTGTYNSWDGNLTKVGATPGQYISIPKNLAGYAGIPRQVPSMSSMLTRVLTSTTNAYVNIAYSSVVMGNTDLQRAPGRNKAVVTEQDVVSTVVTVEGANSGDKLWLFANDNFTRTYDNGYDGIKQYPTVGQVSFFASESDYGYQINSVDDFNNTLLKFRASSDLNYTMTFEHENTENKYESIYLYDMLKDSTVNITETGSTYTFTATNSTSTQLRFRIITNPLSNGTTTSTPESNINVFAADNSLFIKRLAGANALVKVTDLTGRLIAEKKVDNNGLITLPIQKQTVYIVTVTSEGQTHSQKVMIK